MKRIMNSSGMYRLIALFLAILLFGYVNMDKINTTRSNNTADTQTLATRKQHVKIRLDLNADTDKYYITGYPNKVDVTLEGPSALVTQTINTLNFQVIADLSKLGTGEHTVKLITKGLNKEISYTINPKTVKVNIQTKDTRKFPIQLHFNKDSIASGYTTGTSKMNVDTVEVTGAKSEVAKIDQVVANVQLSRGTKTDIDQEVLLQVLDKNGETVNVIISPQTVHVTIPVYLPSKKVAVKLTQTGTPVDGKSYDISSNTDTVTIYGPQSALDDISTLSANIDISGISATETQNIQLTSGDKRIVKITPESVTATIKVTNSSNSSSETSSSTD